MFKQKSDPAAATLAPADAVQQARTRARQRLIGAVVLLGIGIVGFPLVFETQPRQIPVDLPIEIPKKDALPPLAMPTLPAPAPAPASRADGAAPPVAGRDTMITESRIDAGRDVTAAPARASVSASAPSFPSSSALSRAVVSAVDATASNVVPSPPRVAVAAPAASVAMRPTGSVVSSSAAASKPAAAANGDSDRARALLEGRAVAAADSQRFVVQVGAFADANSARETRLKVEKLGLRTYTQVAQTPDGNRIRVRVGPFGTRAEADAALAKAKGAGLNAVVLTL